MQIESIRTVQPESVTANVSFTADDIAAAFMVVPAWGTGNSPFVYNATFNELPLNEPYTSLSQGSVTKYFRTTFNYTASLLGATFRLRHVVDEGIILYLNGEDIFRYNLPEGEVLPDTPASPAVGGATQVDVLEIPTGKLQAGTNLVAVELHGRSITDLDWVFALEFKVQVKSFAYGPVVITKQPQSQAVMEGQPVTFSFEGVGPSRYQWYRNGQIIAGANNPTYTILSTPLTYSNSTFYVRAQNRAVNTATSSNAVLTLPL